MTRSLLCLMAALVLLLVGCTSTKQSVPRVGINAPSSEQAVISVERKYSRRGGMRQITVLDNGKEVGKLGNCGRLTWARPAGDMTLSLQPSFWMVKDSVTPLETSVTPGETHRYSVVWDNQQNSFVVVAE
ncbi:hypothetical protein [Desulfoferrobacter suflitae]|uniref:hypothetical protein n=1 Tax=Desulfoferrobacter suflitae TaxID=2865782 RepID=UPI002164468B|nr:hypothetical protein [Desulfoferrobacter suflitae]MCK8603970.1 hypothetical protein [Desulfoferrobacter suflitae]